MFEVEDSDEPLSFAQIEFLHDQRTQRVMQIDTIGTTNNHENLNPISQNEPDQQQFDSTDSSLNDDMPDDSNDTHDSDSDFDDSDPDSDYNPSEDENVHLLSKTSIWKHITDLRTNEKNGLCESLAASNSKVIIQFDGKNYRKLNERHVVLKRE